MTITAKKKTSGPSGKHVTPRRKVSMSAKEFAQTDVAAKKAGLPWGSWAKRTLLEPVKLVAALIGLAAFSSGCAFTARAGTKVWTNQPQSYCYPFGGAQRCFDSEAEMKAERLRVYSVNPEEERAAHIKAAQERIDRESQERDQNMDALVADPAVAVPVLSAVICEKQSSNAVLDQNLEREKRIATASGVSDFGERRDIAESRDDNDQWIASLTTKINDDYSALPIPCGKLEVLLSCHQQGLGCNGIYAQQMELWDKGHGKLGINR